jgi:hypothetical protein
MRKCGPAISYFLHLDIFKIVILEDTQPIKIEAFIAITIDSIFGFSLKRLF